MLCRVENEVSALAKPQKTGFIRTNFLRPAHVTIGAVKSRRGNFADFPNEAKVPKNGAPRPKRGPSGFCKPDPFASYKTIRTSGSESAATRKVA